jgi:hypothetical protein
MMPTTTATANILTVIIIPEKENCHFAAAE